MARSRTRAFDHTRLAAALARVADTTVDPARLPFLRLGLSDNLRVLTVEVRRRRWGCDLQSYLCTQSPATTPRNSVTSKAFFMAGPSGREGPRRSA